MSKPREVASASIQQFMSIQPALKAKANPIRNDDWHKQGQNPIRNDDWHKQGEEPQPFMPRNQ